MKIENKISVAQNLWPIVGAQSAVIGKNANEETTESLLILPTLIQITKIDADFNPIINNFPRGKLARLNTKSMTMLILAQDSVRRISRGPSEMSTIQHSLPGNER
jgi:hypothetical protein